MNSLQKKTEEAALLPFPSIQTRSRLVDSLIVRALEKILHVVAFREVQVQALRRNGAFEPLLVDLVTFTRGFDSGNGVIDYLLEFRIVLAQHAAIRFTRLR